MPNLTVREKSMLCKTGSERLSFLAEFLENHAPDNFSLENWIGENDCGTTFCACGYAADAGLFGLLLDESGGLYAYNIDGRQVSSWKAVEAIFFLDSTEAKHLFAPGSYASWDNVEVVIDRIRDFVKNGMQ